MNTPKILLRQLSDGGSAVFPLEYYGKEACLAQSPQLHKQMLVCSDFRRVFEMCPVFRAESFSTNRHLCEYIALHAEMEIKGHYFEVLELVERLLLDIFDGLNGTCQNSLAAIKKEHPFEDLKYTKELPRISFQEAVHLLQEDGVDVGSGGDPNTESEKRLGEIVLQRYGSDVYTIHKYPLAARPFYTMPCHDNNTYTCSFDVFMRGEEIITGGQRIHDPELLTERAQACGLDLNNIFDFVDSFRYGAWPRGGFGAGLERMVKLFLGLRDIRRASPFPRDPSRLCP